MSKHSVPLNVIGLISRNATRAIQNYGEKDCRDAYEWHHVKGYGTSGILHEMPSVNLRTFNQVDAAINAGRELAQLDEARRKALTL